MTLEVLPEYKKRRIAVGTTVRKPLDVLKPYLASLDWQERAADVQFEYAFVPDFAPGQQDALDYLQRWVADRRGTLLQGAAATTVDFSDAPGLDSHQWQASAMARVGWNKNQIIQFALHSKCDALWFVDADLVMDRTTFRSLDAAEQPIVSAVYWTRWTRRGTETAKVHAAPQVWLRHPYELNGRGMDDAEFRQKLVSRGLVRVWGYGACTLIQRSVLEAGVSFEYLPDVPQSGLMAGEDRHFCIRAERLHIPAFADNWPDIFHIYHGDEDVPRVPEMVAELGKDHPKRPRLGDLVSLRIRAMEPLPIGPGRAQYQAPQMLRGRLGQIRVLPEIEEAIHGLERGGRAVIRCHFPVHYPLPAMRGRSRLIEVTLVDCKPFRFAPVLEDEMFVGTASRGVLDMTTLTPDQHESIQEIARG